MVPLLLFVGNKKGETAIDVGASKCFKTNATEIVILTQVAAVAS